MDLSESGQIVQDEILDIPQYNERLQLGEWVVMPNHIHMIIEIMDGDGDGTPPTAPTPWWYDPDHQPRIDEIDQTNFTEKQTRNKIERLKSEWIL